MTTADGRSGSTVGKYRLHEVVGRGGMGVVYRAEHVYIGREVAVKILHEGYGGREESIKRFLREARAASLINHPNIVEVTDFGKANDGTVFFVMELLVGEPLDAILARERRLDLLRSITICNQLTAALAAAHSKDIIHRDLKPENVMLIPREGRRELVRRVSDESGAYELSEREKQFDFVKILDFGVAKVREPEAQKGRVTKAGIVFGTPEYMAPETARIGYSDARSDIYALGIMFYEMMTGVVPFSGDAPVEVMMKQVNDQVPPMRKVCPEAEITEDAERMILKALAKDPEQRHQSMEEFHRDLQKCYGQLRFRRTLRTPTAMANQASPSAATIPLTKKKKKAGVPGAIPSAVRLGGSSPGELDTGMARPRNLTPPLPGLPVNATAPILLTKKKAPRTESAVLGRATPRQPKPAITMNDTPLGPDAITREIPKDGVGSTVVVAATDEHGGGAATAEPAFQQKADGGRATPTSSRKRTTLPLGHSEEDRERGAQQGTKGKRLTPRPTITVVDGSGSGEGRPVMDAFSAGTQTGPADTEERAAQARDGETDRPTPRVATMTSTATTTATATGGDARERSWLDAKTTPGAKDYPGSADKAGKVS